MDGNSRIFILYGNYSIGMSPPTMHVGGWQLAVLVLQTSGQELAVYICQIK